METTVKGVTIKNVKVTMSRIGVHSGDFNKNVYLPAVDITYVDPSRKNLSIFAPLSEANSGPKRNDYHGVVICGSYFILLLTNEWEILSDECKLLATMKPSGTPIEAGIDFFSVREGNSIITYNKNAEKLGSRELTTEEIIELANKNLNTRQHKAKNNSTHKVRKIQKADLKTYSELINMLPNFKNELKKDDKSMSLKKYIIEQFNIGENEDPKNDFKSLQNEIDSIKRVLNAMQSIQLDCKHEIVKYWRTRTITQYPHLSPCQTTAFSDVSIPIANGQTIKIKISENYNRRRYYEDTFFCRVDYICTSDEENDNYEAINEVLKDVLPMSNGQGVWWKYLPFYQFDELYSLFEEVITKLCQQFHISLTK